MRGVDDDHRLGRAARFRDTGAPRLTARRVRAPRAGGQVASTAPLKMATVQAILTLHERGWSRRPIAVELDVDRETISRYIELARQASQPTAEATSNPASAPICRPGHRRFQTRPTTLPGVRAEFDSATGSP